MIFPADHNVFALFNAKIAIVTHGNPFNERCRKRHCRPMGHYLVFCCCTSNENSRDEISRYSALKGKLTLHGGTTILKGICETLEPEEQKRVHQLALCYTSLPACFPKSFGKQDTTLLGKAFGVSRLTLFRASLVNRASNL